MLFIFVIIKDFYLDLNDGISLNQQRLSEKLKLTIQNFRELCLSFQATTAFTK